jgi:hypothetical protein
VTAPGEEGRAPDGRDPAGDPEGRFERSPVPGSAGLCPVCPHVRRIVSDRGSVFLLCTRAREDPTLPRYPPQPRRACHGFPATGAGDAG